MCKAVVLFYAMQDRDGWELLRKIISKYELSNAYRLMLLLLGLRVAPR